MNYFIVIIGLNLIMTVILSLGNIGSRTSNGILFPRKRFLPSNKDFHLGKHKSRNRLRCIHLCQESSHCQTVMYNQMTQECNLFSEHIEYGLGRLYDENNDNLITIRLDKDTHKMKEQINKQTSIILSTTKQKQSDENCEL
ncbi:hypothetical protein I4U23_006285 [Adineta vaga]|nr:hypothetical protein I4U23_006285 [Adineta vaga]